MTYPATMTSLYRQSIKDLRWSAPNSDVIVKDKQGKILRIEDYMGNVIKDYSKEGSNA